MSAIRGVIFDKDGTLFDFSRTWEAWAVSFLARLAPDPAERERLAGAIGFDQNTRRFARDSVAIAGTPGEIAQALRVHTDRDPGDLIALINAEASDAPQVEAVPLAPFLAGLQVRGLALGVVTNDAEAPARVHLGRAGATDYFQFIAGFDSGFGAKPAPGQLLAFAEHTGLAPADIVMVGDSTRDLLAGRAAGMRCAGVLTGMATQDDLAPFADVVMDTIGGLPAWIETQV